MAGTSNQDDSDLANLQSSFDEQQAKISALREIIRQTEAVNDMKHASAQEKVKNIAQRLTHFKTKVTTSRLNRASSIGSSSQSLATIDQGVALKDGPVDARPDPRSPAFPRGRSESSGMEKCSLLRQQIEQNRLKMAERESSQREIEEKVIEIKHKLEATQQSLDRSSTTCLAEIVSSVGDGGGRDPAFDLSDSLRRSFSHSFLDPGPAHETISTPIKPVKDSEEQFNEELIKFEDNVRQAQVKRKSDEMLERRITTLEDDLHEKERVIDEQLRALSLLVNSLLEENDKSDLELVKELHNLQTKLLQQSYSISTDEAISRLLESYGYDPLQKAAERKQIQQQAASTPPVRLDQHETSDEAKVQLYDALEKIATLEQALASQDIEMERMNQQMTDLRQSLEEKTIELNVMTANVSVLQEKLKTSGPKPLFPRSADEELESETTKLKQQLDDSNKNMIKCKLKIKQLQKQVDTFKKTSNVHEEIAKLTEENTSLTQRLAEIEERNTTDTRYDATDPKPVGPELQKRIEMLELTCQHQATAMQLLEEQKNDLSEDLNRTRNELQSLTDHVTVTDGDGDNGRIASQMLSIELEEKLEKCLADKSELTKVLHSWETEKSELQQKLKRYADENAELLGKIDKLSLEKVSSAESIEILENLTLHEKQEMENSEKRAKAEDGATEMDDSDEIVRNVLSGKEDLNESLLKLMEESKELMDKVELFTDERREVLEKLDAISIENQAYLSELDKLKEANEQLRTYSVELASAKSDLEDKLRVINEEKETIRQELDTVKVRKLEGVESSVTPSSAASLPAQMTMNTTEEAFDKDVYQQSLMAVEMEITNYNKNKDKQKKMQLAKKLTVSAKTLVTMSRQLIDEYGRCKDERTARTACNDSTISTLETKLAETIKCLESKASQIALLQEEIAMLKHELEVAYEKSSDDEPELLKVELNSKNDEIMLLKKDIDALVDAKSSELLQIQHRLLETQQENHQLKTYTTELQYQLETVSKQQAMETETLNRQIDQLRTELRNATSNVPESASEELEGKLQHKQETIDTLNGQIIELYRTVEEHQTQVDEFRTQKEQVEHKNEELLEKLKKFAANLKKKNVQCTKLEKDIEALKESNRKLNEQVAHMDTESTPTSDVSELSQEKEQLSQKMYHLNNELHRLLEQKYHMESESECSRDELRKLNEELTVVRSELQSKTDALQSLEAELQACKEEMQTMQTELAGKNGKIDKCKAIIKEKIKETQRLQERERRAAYLEDELRMTQSKLEDFHNQTLLLGRLKSEKEELNATVRAEQEQCKNMEQQLANLRQQLAIVQDRNNTLVEQLKRVENWVQRYSEKWRNRQEQTTALSMEESIEIPSDVFSWLSLLAETDRDITQMLARQIETVSALENSLQNTEERAKLASSEIEYLQTRLQSVTNERDQYAVCCSERDQSLDELKRELDTKATELQTAVAANTLMQSQQSELTAALNEIERLKEHMDRSQQSEQTELRNVVETANRERVAIEQRLNEATQSNAELMEEIATLRDSVQSLEQELDVERNNITRVTEATTNRLEEITQLRESLSEAEERYSKQCDRYKDYEMIQLQLVEEKQQKEQLNEALKQREQELQTLRYECDELREHQADAGKLQSIEMESLKQRLYDMEQMHVGWEASLVQFRTENEAQADEITQLRDMIASLERQTQEDKTNISILTSLNGALNEDLDMLQQQTGEAEQRYQSLLDELSQTKSALGVAEAQQSQLQQQTDNADVRYRTLQSEYEQNKLALESVTAAVLEKSNEKDQLTEALQLKEQECEKAHQQCTELRDECDKLQLTLAETKSSMLRQEQPVTEPKPEHDLGMWDDADVGWGTVDTARLEALVLEKDELIQQLGAEKDLMQQEITDLKVKSGKLLRKVKECKVKLDAQQTESVGGRAASTESQDALEAKVQKLEQECEVLVREKEANVLKLDMLESACEKLTEVKEYQDKQIEMLRESVATATASQEVEELRQKVQQMTATLQTRQSEIAHLNARLEQLTAEVECIDELRAQLTEAQCQNVQLQTSGSVQATVPPFHDPAHSMELQLAELEHKNRLLEQEKMEMSGELEALNQQILHDLQFEDRLNKALLELDAKGVEIQMLRSTLEQLQQADGTVATASATSTDSAPEQIATLQAHIQQLERERTELWQKLTDVSEANSSTSGAVAQVDDATVREVLERQEVEIVTLKEQLALRSAEYARLAARVDPTKLFASGLSGSEPVPKPEQQQPQPPAGDRVPQAELELALYMIYQRDMRCDELELELRNLLQERDTLQLRLSNALRMHEEFKMRFAGAIPAEQEYGTSGECSIDASPDRSLSGLPVDERPISSLSGPQDLTSKLSELQSISYSKEKRWQEEREERNRQLTLIQRDLANMPVEAAAKIAGTDVTADTEATTQQSASTVLLNWILGKK
ncbi:protein lava lamp isoform X2 [Anopheles funestus]|uniref:protein lava lamp isoform X2 n=1 Tax=Anopheles funestus TaxID=62324 RepID=UPI0020C5C898|nr:protein lava lamp isoform X2 [Anopheles funestus]